jgi:AcrR family transcriptional regulator
MVDPRVARSREAVIRAGIELVADGGVRAFSVDAVSARSGVAKTTIYRHWPARRDLLNEVFDSFDSHTPTPDTGSLRDDLRSLARGLAVELAEADWAKSLTALVGEAEHDRDLAEVHVRHVRHEMTAIREVLERAQARGELAPTIDIELAAEHVVGALFFRRLVLHDTNTRQEVDQLVDLTLAGLTPRSEST